MSRSGYSEDHDNWDLIRWRGQVASATRGKRGQAMLRKTLEAFDLMKDRRLIKGELVTKEGDCCALGVALVASGVADPWALDGDNEIIAEVLEVAQCLVMEVEELNDVGPYRETDEQRWVRMRGWIKSQIKEQR